MQGAPDMSARPIVVDTTRLLTRLKHPSPSGIDRVDLAYARRFLTGAPDRAALAATSFGMRYLPARLERALQRRIAERWKEELPADQDPVLATIRRSLSGDGDPEPRRPEPGRLPRLAFDVAEQVRKLGAIRWREAVEVPPGSVYVHTSHLRLDRPQLFDWLHKRPDVRPVFFVHDLIPIDFPEYAVPGEDARHRVRMDTVARHAAAVIVNSADVADRFSRHVAESGLRSPPVTVAPLGVEPPFLAEIRRAAPGRPYFVICGTVEARKNHLLLLQVWRELAARLGRNTPALVVVGRRGWESEAAIDLLDRSEALRGHVFEAAGLSTAALAELVGGARALLMPSFAEGYGIPIVEALSLGTPVIASDLAVHREIAGDHATFLHPLDGPGWAREIALMAAEPAHTISRGSYERPTWDAHFRIVEAVLAKL